MNAVLLDWVPNVLPGVISLGKKGSGSAVAIIIMDVDINRGSDGALIRCKATGELSISGIELNLPIPR
jgi:hypothetical protein